MADEQGNKAPAADNPDESQADDKGKSEPTVADLQAEIDALKGKLDKSVGAEKGLRSRLKEAESKAAKADEYEAKERKRKEAEMSDAEKAAAEAQELREKLAAQTAELEKTRRDAAVASAGVSDTYRGFVNYELSQALEQDADLDIPKWLDDFKADHSEMFGNGSNPAAKPAPKGGEGGPGVAGAKGAADAEAMLATYRNIQTSSRPEHMQDRVRLAKDYKALTGREIRVDAHER